MAASINHSKYHGVLNTARFGTLATHANKIFHGSLISSLPVTDYVINVIMDASMNIH